MFVGVCYLLFDVLEAWVDPDVSRLSTEGGGAVGLGKRPLVSRLVKAAFVESAVAPTGANNVMAIGTARGVVSKQDAYKWMHQQMNVTIATGCLSMRGPCHIISHCGDAGRVGKPALDLFFSTAWVEELGRAIEYAPAVSRHV